MSLRTPFVLQLAGLTQAALLRYRPIPIDAFVNEASAGHQLMCRTSDGHGAPTAAIATARIPRNPPLLGRKLLATWWCCRTMKAWPRNGLPV